MNEIDLQSVLRDLLEGSEIRLFRTLSPLQEPSGYAAIPGDWTFKGTEARTEHRIEFTRGGQRVAGWFAYRDGEVKAAQSFPEGPFEIRIAGDAVKFQAVVSAVAKEA